MIIFHDGFVTRHTFETTELGCNKHTPYITFKNSMFHGSEVLSELSTSSSFQKEHWNSLPLHTIPDWGNFGKSWLKSLPFGNNIVPCRGAFCLIKWSSVTCQTFSPKSISHEIQSHATLIWFQVGSCNIQVLYFNVASEEWHPSLSTLFRLDMLSFSRSSNLLRSWTRLPTTHLVLHVDSLVDVHTYINMINYVCLLVWIYIYIYTVKASLRYASITTNTKQ